MSPYRTSAGEAPAPPRGRLIGPPAFFLAFYATLLPVHLFTACVRAFQDAPLAYLRRVHEATVTYRKRQSPHAQYTVWCDSN